jgi:hypothetical protein
MFINLVLHLEKGIKMYTAISFQQNDTKIDLLNELLLVDFNSQS